MSVKKTLKTEDVVKNAEEKVISQAELDTLKAQASQLADVQAQLADLEKAKSELATTLEDTEKAKKEAETALEDIQKAKAAQELEDTVDVVKGFNLFEEGQVEDVAKYFMSNKGETANLILTTLEKAREAIQAFGEKEHGTDLEGETLDTTKSVSDAVSSILKSRKTK